MSSSEFTEPAPMADDYYDRVGAPPDEDAESIGSHGKKYVKQLRPELSNDENAEEKWDRFNTAWQVLREEDEKELYDIFRKRFGEHGVDIYESWDQRDRPGDPSRIGPRDLGLDPERFRDEEEAGSAGQQSRSGSQETTRGSTGDQQAKSGTRGQRQTETGSADRTRPTDPTEATNDDGSTYTTRDGTSGSGTQSATSAFTVLSELIPDSVRVPLEGVFSHFEFFASLLIAYGVLLGQVVPSLGISSGSVSGSLLLLIATALLGYGFYEVFDRYVSTN